MFKINSFGLELHVISNLFLLRCMYSDLVLNGFAKRRMWPQI